MASSERTAVPADLPREPLDIRNTNNGLLPPVGLHARGRLYVQESSYANLVLLAIVLGAALAVFLLPWKEISPIQGWPWNTVIAGILLWTGFCSGAMYGLRNRFGQTILVDPVKRTWTIRCHRSAQVIAWADLIGIQICRQYVSATSQVNGYQLNLVWRDAAGALRRHCLQKHAFRRFIVALGERYRALFRIALFDQTAPG